MHEAGFIGRGRELAALGRALAAPSALVVVEGEAGIGKSRLVQEFRASPAAKDHVFLVASCLPFRQPHTLGPVADALRHAADGVRGLGLSALAGALRPLFPEWAAALPPAPETAEDASAARHRMFQALAEFAFCLGVDVLVVEDAQWADDATLEFLLFLTSQPRRVRLLLTYRPEDVPAGCLLRMVSSRSAPDITSRRISLGPLTVTETSRLMSSMLDGEPVSAEFAALVHGRTDGVPLAVEESVRLLHERFDLIRRKDSWMLRHVSEIDVPPSIRDAVLERVQRLAEDPQVVLRAAAVLADPAPEAVLFAVAGLAAGQGCAALSRALSAGLLQEDSRGLVSFRSMLACRAVHDAMAAPDRRALHLKAGQVLEGLSPQPVSELARHFRAAGDTCRWLRYGEQAADLALDSGDEATAVAVLHDLLTGADLTVGSVARLTRKIPVASFTGSDRYQELVHALRSVLDAEGLDPAGEAEIRVLLGQVFIAQQEWSAGRAELERAIPRLPAGSADAIRAMQLLGWPCGSTCPRSVHLRWLRRAAALASTAGPGDDLRFVVDQGTALLLLGQEEGWAQLDQVPAGAPTAAGRRQIARAHLNTGDQAMRWGRYGVAAERLEQGLELARRHGFARLRDEAMVTQIHLDWLTGSWEALSERAAAAIDNPDIQPVTRLEATMVAGLLQGATGARALAKEQLQLVLGESRRLGAIPLMMELAAALARLSLANEGVDEALQSTGEPVDVLLAKKVWIWATDVVPARIRALGAAGRIGEATRLTQAFARGLRGCTAPAPRAALLHCRALLAQAGGDHRRAAAAFSTAATAWQALPRPYEALLAREQQARCLLHLGQDGTGRQILSEVAEGLRKLGARNDASRVMRTLQPEKPGPNPARRPGRPSYGDRLSPRELEVVRLVASGQTNRQIATALVISVQTVASHLRSTMRKLQASSRTALAVKAVEMGLVRGKPDSRAPSGGAGERRRGGDRRKRARRADDAHDGQPTADPEHDRRSGSR